MNDGIWTKVKEQESRIKNQESRTKNYEPSTNSIVKYKFNLASYQ